jgi:glycosyltransferase involved in cell wall biosynthesis
MNEKKLKILMIVEQCNPQWASVPLVAYKLYDEISKLVDVTLVTHERNKIGIESVRADRKVYYIPESKFLTEYYKWTDRLANRGTINWPLYHLLNYPLYASFDRAVYKFFNKKITQCEFDIVHSITPMMPRYPVKVINACRSTPFIIGPVNGGVPFPKGFKETARKEFAHFNFLRFFGRHLIPGYKRTYTKADKILVGSSYTKEMLKETFKLDEKKLNLFYENGIEADISPPNRVFLKDTLNILFVGRLVPYKGADMVISALMEIPKEYRSKIELTIVGDGSERVALEEQCRTLGLTNQVNFVGWVEQKNTLSFYQKADIFCFPSIREFGGAVVLEAMACGLPCVVVNNGGIGEYVTEETGFKIEPLSRKYIVDSISIILMKILKNDVDLKTKSDLSILRVAEFRWSSKALKIQEIYKDLLNK